MEDSSSPPLTGSSVPIRAPLTIDSDSELNFSVNGNNYSRNSSFNSSSSSIDLSSYEQENDPFEAYPDDEIVKKISNVEQNAFSRAFVKYPDANCVIESSSLDNNDFFRSFKKYPDEDSVKESGSFDKNVVFRSLVKYLDGDYVKESSDFDKDVVLSPFVKYQGEESGSGSGDLGMKLGLGAPVARLTSDCDTDIDSDSDSVDGRKRLLSVGICPKATVFSGADEGDSELQVVFSCDDVNDIEELKSVLAESIEDEGCRFDCFNEVVGFLESDDLETPDAHIDLNSNLETEFKTINVTLPESVKSSCDLDRIHTQHVSSSDNEIELNSISAKLPQSVKSDDAHSDLNSDREMEIKTINLKLPESDKMSCDMERIDEHVVSSSNNEIEIESINVKFLESDELSFVEEVNPQIFVDSNKVTEIQTTNTELSESDKSCFDLKSFSAHISPVLENKIEIETISENKQEVVFDCYGNESMTLLNVKEEEKSVKRQTREKFLRFALDKQLTFKVNEKDNLNLYLTILVIGKTGTGKSATINSIFGATKTLTNAFRSETTTIQEITGKVDGIQLRVFDTPGFKCSPSERSYNLRILKSVKRLTQKHTPNIVLYVDRLDTYAQDEVNDSQFLRLITTSLGSWVWGKCMIALTHAGCNPGDESEGSRFVFQRCCFVQQQIVNNGGNMGSPVWVVENEPQERSKWFEVGGLEGFNVANKDERQSIEAATVERKKVYFKDDDDDDGYRVQIFGNRHWSLACRFYS